MRKFNIIILNWNSCELLKTCLKKIMYNTPIFNRTVGQEPYEIIIVDNGSTKDNSIEYLKTLPHKVIYNSQNQGYAGGVNVGIRASDPEADLVLLNVDAEVQQGWIGALYDTMERGPDFGLVGPLGNNVPTNLQRLGSVHVDTIVPNLHFFCVLIKREVINKIGLFDTRYGLGNYDDNDYGTRARLAGYVHCISAKSVVLHEPHQVFRLNGVDNYRLERENRDKFLNKFFGIMLDYSKEYDFFAKTDLAKRSGLVIF